jgi:ApbE superfamily uncharacterized protein (UPF0280 family)
VFTPPARCGPPLRRGVPDAAIAFSEDVLLADAAATALGNKIQSKDPRHIETVLADFQPAGIRGMMAIAGKTLVAWGTLPELCRADVEYDLITRGI